jgi:hypothetical protein
MGQGAMRSQALLNLHGSKDAVFSQASVLVDPGTVPNGIYSVGRVSPLWHVVREIVFLLTVLTMSLAQLAA